MTVPHHSGFVAIEAVDFLMQGGCAVCICVCATRVRACASVVRMHARVFVCMGSSS